MSRRRPAGRAPLPACTAWGSPAGPSARALVARGGDGGARRRRRPGPACDAAWPGSWAAEVVRAAGTVGAGRAGGRRRRRRAEPRACRTAIPCSPPRAAAGVPVLCEFDLAGAVGRPAGRGHHRHQRQDHRHHPGRRDMLEASGRRAVAVRQHRGAARRGHRRPRPPRCSWSRRRRSASATAAASRPEVGDLAQLRPGPPRRARSRWPPTRRPRPGSGPTRGATTSPSPTPTTRWWLRRRLRPGRPTRRGHLRAAPRRRAPLRLPPRTAAGCVGPRRARAGRRRRAVARPAPRPGQRPGRGGDGAGRRGRPCDGVRAALRAFRGLPHRVELVGERDGVRWFDDSKATAPHATLAAAVGASTRWC